MRTSARPSSRWQVAAVSCVLALALAACGSDNGDVDPDAPAPVETEELEGPAVPNACSLLSTQEVQQATGRTAQDGALNDDLVTETQSVCEWPTEPKKQKQKKNAPDEISFVQVVVNRAVYKDARDEAREVLGKAPAIDVPGAEKAYITGDGTIVGLEVEQFFAQVTNLPLNEAAVKDLASKVAFRLSGEEPPPEKSNKKNKNQQNNKESGSKKSGSGG